MVNENRTSRFIKIFRSEQNTKKQGFSVENGERMIIVSSVLNNIFGSMDRTSGLSK